jgi:hypothetical protein
MPGLAQRQVGLTAMIKQFAELDDGQKAQVRGQFSATPLVGRTFDDYVYEVDEQGLVISRKTRAEHERKIAVLVKPQPKTPKVDGWDV